MCQQNNSLADGYDKAMRADSSLPAGWKSNFMLQPYYVSLYLDCPPNLGLSCPSPAAVEEFKAAAKAGDVHWQAFPCASLAFIDHVLPFLGIPLSSHCLPSTCICLSLIFFLDLFAAFSAR